MFKLQLVTNTQIKKEYDRNAILSYYKNKDRFREVSKHLFYITESLKDNAMGIAKRHSCESIKSYKNMLKSIDSTSTKTYELIYNDRRYSNNEWLGKRKHFFGPIKFECKDMMDASSQYKTAKVKMITRIKAAREVLKHVNKKNKSVYLESIDSSEHVEMIAGCHYETGFFLTLKKLKLAKNVYVNKTPLTKDHHLGIELEFFCKKDSKTLGSMLFDAGLDSNVTLKADGSIRADSGYHAHELCIIAKENEYKDIVKRVTTLLSESEAKINKSCGMHVHIDVRLRNKEVVFSNLVSSQKFLYAMNPRSRSENSFCKKTKSKEFKTSGDRYLGINPNAYRRHNTIEVRIHSGTIEYTKIVNWVDILLGVVNKQDEIKRAATKLSGFAKQFALSSNLVQYMSDRIAKFAVPEAEQIEEAA